MSVREFERDGVWKWVAAILAAILLAGLPGYVQLLRDERNHPTREEVALLRDRQDAVLQRLAAIDVRLAQHEVEDETLQAQIDAIRLGQR